MSIASLATGDTVAIELQTTTTGEAWGSVVTYAEVSGKGAVVCRVDGPSASEAKKYEATGEQWTHTVFFSSDQVLTRAHRLRWHKEHGQKTTISPARYLQVLSYNRQNNPSGSLKLFIAECNEDSITAEPAAV